VKCDPIKRMSAAFVCNYAQCSKQYKRKSDLLRHQRSHTGERNFTCEHCKLTFYRSDVFKRHVQRHLDAKSSSSSLSSTTEESTDIDTSSASLLHQEYTTALLYLPINNPISQEGSNGNDLLYATPTSDNAPKTATSPSSIDAGHQIRPKSEHYHPHPYYNSYPHPYSRWPGYHVQSLAPYQYPPSHSMLEAQTFTSPEQPYYEFDEWTQSFRVCSRSCL